jgi:uncharacterized OB-fold protein
MADWLVADSLVPHTDGTLAPMYAAATAGQLAMPHCGACRQALELEQLRCDACGGTDIAWLPVDASGTIHSVTIVHRREPGLIVANEPYVVVDVELASGHRLVMTTDRPTTTSPAIGDPARIVFRDVAGVPVPSLSTAEEMP